MVQYTANISMNTGSLILIQAQRNILMGTIEPLQSETTLEAYRFSDRDIKQDVENYLPGYYAESHDVQGVLQTLVNEFIRASALASDILDQFYPKTATWGLERWEKYFKITVLEGEHGELPIDPPDEFYPIVTNGLIGYWNSRHGINGTSWSNIAPGGETLDGIIGGATKTPNGLFFDGVGDFADIPLPAFMRASDVGPRTIEFILEPIGPWTNKSFITERPPTTDINGRRSYLDQDTIYFRGLFNTIREEIGLYIPGVNRMHVTIGMRPSDSFSGFVTIQVYDYDTGQVHQAGYNVTMSGMMLGIWMRLSGRSPEQMFHGVIDSIKMYNRILTNGEIRQNRLAHKRIGLPNLQDSEPELPDNDNGLSTWGDLLQSNTTWGDLLQSNTTWGEFNPAPPMPTTIYDGRRREIMERIRGFHTVTKDVLHYEANRYYRTVVDHRPKELFIGLNIIENEVQQADPKFIKFKARMEQLIPCHMLTQINIVGE